MEARNQNTRQALLDAAAELVAGAPGQDVPLRAICDRVGVQLPTLYHHFGSKSGLLEAVVEHGFDRYVGLKRAQESTGDPIEDVRQGWDAHVRFGLDNPAFYALMYGQVIPGYRPAAQARPTAALRELTARAAREGRLVVDPVQAADHVLAANVGVTLHLITADAPDPALSAAVREATIAAVTGTRAAGTAPADDGTPAAAAALLRTLAAGADHPLGEPEQALLRKWLAALARTD